jgi:hypothetical protein
MCELLRIGKKHWQHWWANVREDHVEVKTGLQIETDLLICVSCNVQTKSHKLIVSVNRGITCLLFVPTNALSLT